MLICEFGIEMTWIRSKRLHNDFSFRDSDPNYDVTCIVLFRFLSFQQLMSSLVVYKKRRQKKQKRTRVNSRLTGSSALPETVNSEPAELIDTASASPLDWEPVDGLSGLSA